MKDVKAFQIVAEAIARQFNIPADTIAAETAAQDVPGWDSFSNGLLIIAMEEMIGGPLPFEAMAAAANVGEMATVVAGQL